MKISVVIPALDEAERIGSLVRSLGPEGLEILVVDGGSRDATPSIARASGAVVLASERGRAAQLRCGSQHANGDLILFLHADTRLPEGWQAAVLGAVRDPAVAGGAFGFRVAERGLFFRWLELWVAVRNALFALPYGDQAIFVRRSVLEAMGGVPVVPLFEDLDLVQGIKRRGRLAQLPLAVTTSGRRYVRGGRLRTLLAHQLALLGWRLGWDRSRLARRIGR